MNRAKCKSVLICCESLYYGNLFKYWTGSSLRPWWQIIQFRLVGKKFYNVRIFFSSSLDIKFWLKKKKFSKTTIWKLYEQKSPPAWTLKTYHLCYHPREGIPQINKLCTISKCIEVFEESRTSAKWSLLIAIKFYASHRSELYTIYWFVVLSGGRGGTPSPVCGAPLVLSDGGGVPGLLGTRNALCCRN